MNKRQTGLQLPHRNQRWIYNRTSLVARFIFLLDEKGKRNQNYKKPCRQGADSL